MKKITGDSTPNDCNPIYLLKCLPGELNVLDGIDQVQNDSLRLILEKWYLCFLPWDTIAKDMNLSYRYLLARHRRAIGVVQQILDEREEERVE